LQLAQQDLARVAGAGDEQPLARGPAALPRAPRLAQRAQRDEEPAHAEEGQPGVDQRDGPGHRPIRGERDGRAVARAEDQQGRPQHDEEVGDADVGPHDPEHAAHPEHDSLQEDHSGSART
jgi:hypothetical protein